MTGSIMLHPEHPELVRIVRVRRRDGEASRDHDILEIQMGGSYVSIFGPPGTFDALRVEDEQAPADEAKGGG